MPTQYPYPEQGWSTGNMRMAKMGPMRGGATANEFRELEGAAGRKKKEAQASENAPQYQTMSPEEWQGYWGKAWEVYGKGSSKIDPTKTSPDGFIIDKNHPQIPELSKDFDIYHIPQQGDEGWSGRYMFMKPRQSEPLTSEAGPGPQRVA